MTRDDVEATVIRAITSSLADMNKRGVQVTCASPVDARLGLESLEWATVIVRLESELGVDPFRDGTVGELNTVGDLVEIYQATLNGKSE